MVIGLAVRQRGRGDRLACLRHVFVAEEGLEIPIRRNHGRADGRLACFSQPHLIRRRDEMRKRLERAIQRRILRISELLRLDDRGHAWQDDRRQGVAVIQSQPHVGNVLGEVALHVVEARDVTLVSDHALGVCRLVHLHDCGVKAAIAVQRRAPFLIGGELDPIRQNEIKEIVGDLSFTAQPCAVDRVEAVEKLRVGAGAALDIGGQSGLEPVVVRALTFVARSQWILFPRESLLFGEELKESFAHVVKGP